MLISTKMQEIIFERKKTRVHKIVVKLKRKS